MLSRYTELIEQLGGMSSDSAEHSPSNIKFENHLAELETLIGCHLPKEYREFLREFGGIMFGLGSLTFPLQTNADQRHTATLSVFHEISTIRWLCTQGREEFEAMSGSYLIEEIPGIRLVKSIPQGVVEIDPPKELLPIAIDAGGSQIYLAIAGKRSGAIFFWNNCHERGAQNIYLAADSFDEFIKSLYL